MSWPQAAQVDMMAPQAHATAEAYLAAQYRLRFDEDVDIRDVTTLPFAIELGRKLKQHVAFQNLLRDTERLGGRAVNLDELSQVVSRRLRDLRAVSGCTPT